VQLIVRKPRLIYDGVCNLCTGAVRFLIAIDRKHAFEYAPYQKLGPDERYGLSTAELQGRMHIVRRDGSVVRGAAAISEACKLLAPIIALCDLFNTPLAQKIYDFIAGRRYRIFGCRDSCYVAAVIETDR
jgi:predicted DCC family thiol-disulfide oxidoreductase YuxK